VITREREREYRERERESTERESSERERKSTQREKRVEIKMFIYKERQQRAKREERRVEIKMFIVIINTTFLKVLGLKFMFQVMMRFINFPNMFKFLFCNFFSSCSGRYSSRSSDRSSREDRGARGARFIRRTETSDYR